MLLLCLFLLSIPSVSLATSYKCCIKKNASSGTSCSDVNSDSEDISCRNNGGDLSTSSCSSVSDCKKGSYTSSSNSGSSSSGSLSYTPMEEIPGFGKSGDFATYVTNLYKFGIWTVGIAALLMIMLGGFMYITSAGNTSSMGKAKTIITDAIIGLIMALTAYILLNTINPALLTIKKLSGTTSTSSTDSGKTGTTGESTKIAKGCTTEVDTALEKAASNNGIDANYMKAIVKCGEGCNANKSSAGACGYGQVIDGPYGSSTKLTWNRCKICGIKNSEGKCDADYSCKAVQNDRDLDMNCSALVIKDAQNKSGCGASLSTLARCYNGGNINANSSETNKYVTKVTNCT